MLSLPEIGSDLYADWKSPAYKLEESKESLAAISDSNGSHLHANVLYGTVSKEVLAIQVFKEESYKFDISISRNLALDLEPFDKNGDLLFDLNWNWDSPKLDLLKLHSFLSQKGSLPQIIISSYNQNYFLSAFNKQGLLYYKSGNYGELSDLQYEIAAISHTFFQNIEVGVLIETELNHPIIELLKGYYKSVNLLNSNLMRFCEGFNTSELTSFNSSMIELFISKS